MTANNVITFPNSGRVITISDVQDRIQDVKVTHIEETLELLVPMLMNQFMLLGFNIDYMNNAKDVALIVESIKSMLMKYYNMEHSIQEIIDKLVIEDDSVGDYVIPNNLRILKKINRKDRVEKCSNTSS